MSRGWLVVFAKAPRAGLVKTRLNPPLSFEECAALYREMLADVLQASAGYAARLDLDPVVSFYPAEGVHEILGAAPAGFRFHVQRGQELGDRMAHSAAEAAASGARMVLIRGSDSPALSFDCVREATTALETGDDVVLTPDQGGGYALIGLKETHPRLFEIPMSTEAVLEQTLDVARDLGLSPSTTRPSFDIDTVGDLQLLEGLSFQEKSDLCPRTVQFLSTIPR